MALVQEGGLHKVTKVVYRYGTGQEIPEGATYLCSIKNGLMKEEGRPEGYEFVWHYFLVEIKT